MRKELYLSEGSYECVWLYLYSMLIHLSVILASHLLPLSASFLTPFVFGVFLYSKEATGMQSPNGRVQLKLARRALGVIECRGTKTLWPLTPPLSTLSRSLSFYHPP